MRPRRATLSVVLGFNGLCRIFVCALALALTSTAFADDIGTYSNNSLSAYNVFLSGSFTNNGSDIEGGLVAGGLISAPNWFAVMQGPAGEPLSAFGTSQLTFISTAGLANTTYNMSDDGGNWYMVTGGGNVTNNGHGGVALSSDPISIATQMQTDQSTSNYLSGMANTTGKAGTDYCTNTSTTVTTCYIYNAGLNVLNVGGTNGYSASWFAKGMEVDISGISATQWAVLNFAGSGAYTVSGNLKLDGQNSDGTPGTGVGTYAQRLLYNFNASTSVTIEGSGFIGSMLAPNATVTDNANGQFDGQLIATSFNAGNTEFHNYLYQGQLTPEPAPVAFMGAGLIFLFAWRNRRRR